MNNFNNFYILSLWSLFETEIVANGSALPFKNLLSINKFWENEEVFLNFSTFCSYSDFLSIVSLNTYHLKAKSRMHVAWKLYFLQLKYLWDTLSIFPSILVIFAEVINGSMLHRGFYQEIFYLTKDKLDRCTRYI